MASAFSRSQPSRELPLELLKDRVYKDNSPTIETLRENITRKIKRIPANPLERVIKNLNFKVAGVIQQHWAWIEHFNNR